MIFVFTKAFPAPPVLLYAYYSRFNFAMFAVAMLKDLPIEFMLGECSKIFAKN